MRIDLILFYYNGVKMQNQTSLLRKEYFGGTLNNAVVARRIHLSRDEYQQVKDLGRLPDGIRAELKIDSSEVLIREPAVLPTDNFSAPDTIFFEITRACNLTCEHCFNSSGKRLPEELSDNERMSVIEDLCDTGVQEVRFTGGEPLVVHDIFKYISRIRSLGLRASIGTNGALINSVIAEKLAQAGLNAAITSIDGMEEKHDQIRGVGSFQKTLAGIEALLRVGIRVRVNTVAMKSNLGEIPLVTEYFFQRGIPIMIRRLIPSGRADGMAGEMLTREDYTSLRERLDCFIADERGLVRGHYLQDDETVTRIKLPFERRPCSAGHRGLVVLPNGGVQTCGFLGPLGESSVGNLKNEKLASLWERLVQSQHITALRALLPGYNTVTSGPNTNCLAIALADHNKLIQIQRR